MLDLTLVGMYRPSLLALTDEDSPWYGHMLSMFLIVYKHEMALLPLTALLISFTNQT